MSSSTPSEVAKSFNRVTGTISRKNSLKDLSDNRETGRKTLQAALAESKAERSSGELSITSACVGTVVLMRSPMLCVGSTG
ncbi:MAG: hypothetical protein NTV55_15935 [Planctomycetota bacterium]|nr:hypothetical protein [Planctomycetota bacterium]